MEAISTAAIARVRPLGTAAFSGDAESARVLLEAGANPNGEGSSGSTPMQTAVANNNQELIELLEAHGADAGFAGGG